MPRGRPGTRAGHCFDSRGVHRLYRLGFDDVVWRLWRDEPGFSQRFTGTFDDDGDRIVGVSELSRDGSLWERDLEITLLTPARLRRPSCTLGPSELAELI